MQLQFIKNIQFTKLVKAEGRLREFNFRKQNKLEDSVFTVDVSDDRGNRIIFSMKRRQIKILSKMYEVAKKEYFMTI